MNILIEHTTVVHECGRILYFLKRVLALKIHIETLSKVDNCCAVDFPKQWKVKANKVKAVVSLYNSYTYWKYSFTFVFWGGLWLAAGNIFTSTCTPLKSMKNPRRTKAVSWECTACSIMLPSCTGGGPVVPADLVSDAHFFSNRFWALKVDTFSIDIFSRCVNQKLHVLGTHVHMIIERSSICIDANFSLYR